MTCPAPCRPMGIIFSYVGGWSQAAQWSLFLLLLCRRETPIQNVILQQQQYSLSRSLFCISWSRFCRSPFHSPASTPGISHDFIFVAEKE